jgi:hypothetical protein
MSDVPLFKEDRTMRRWITTVVAFALVTLGAAASPALAGGKPTPALTAGGKPTPLLAAAPQIPSDCKLHSIIVPGVHPQGDTSVTLWMDLATCAISGVDYIRANARNERTSGKTDWAIAVKAGLQCHQRVVIAPPAVHPHVTAGHTFATPWTQYHSSDFWWAEVTTTYPTPPQHFGQTACFV